MPLTDELTATQNLKIPKGALSFDHSLSSAELFDALKTITSQASIRDLKIEEPDFEDVIRLFLEKESSLHKARNIN